MIWISLLISTSFIICATAEPGVERYQTRHSKTLKQNDFKSQGSAFPYQAPGRCFKEVPVAEIARGHFLPVGNSSNPGFSIISVCCDGYREVVGGICEPICEKSCRNGKCVRPNVCQCFSNYVMSLAEECVNTCPFGCLNGHCANGFNCTCHPGYILDPTRKLCIPACTQNCGINGNCTAPNVCGCNKGFGIDLNTLLCEPQCNPPCGAGRCLQPGKCECNPGYFLKDNSCQTNCSRGCLNGRCVAPEVCTCDIGWELSQSNDKCEPVCKDKCPNGICVAPNTCQCLPGYTKKSPSSNICKAVCKRGCLNGDCVAPEVCSCRPGWTLTVAGNRCKKVDKPHIQTYPTQLQPAPIPPPIFQPTVSISQPKCNPQCINGQCVGVNSCSCFSGYTQDSWLSYKCNPYCFNGCANGVCKAPNVCECNQGFEKVGQLCVRRKLVTTTLRPGCSQPCINGRCMGSKCECNFGFVKDAKNEFACIPYCTGGCTNATCVAPNTCHCFPGYKKKTSNVCERIPVHCDKQCLNGFCVDRNQCQCNPGYAVQSNVYNVCTPVCQGGCANGSCLQPNKCVCNAGFTLQNNICVWTGYNG